MTSPEEGSGRIWVRGDLLEEPRHEEVEGGGDASGNAEEEDIHDQEVDPNFLDREVLLYNGNADQTEVQYICHFPVEV